MTAIQTNQNAATNTSAATNNTDASSPAPLRAWEIARLPSSQRGGREPLSGKNDFYNLHRDLSVIYPPDQGQPITASGRLLWHLTPEGLIIQAPADLPVNIQALTSRFAAEVRSERILSPEQVLQGSVNKRIQVQVKVNAEARTGKKEDRAASSRQRSREEIAQWLKGKEGLLGLSITDIQVSEIRIHNQDRPTRGQRQRRQTGVIFSSADVEFGAVIVDHLAFARALRTGLGRSRGFGCGMLSPRMA